MRDGSAFENVREARRRAVARRTDPETSWAAAHSLGDLRESQFMVYLCIAEHGPLIDEKLVELMVGKMSASGARTRRSELVDVGLVEFTGDYGLTTLGNRSRMWDVKRGQLGLL